MGNGFSACKKDTRWKAGVPKHMCDERCKASVPVSQFLQRKHVDEWVATEWMQDCDGSLPAISEVVSHRNLETRWVSCIVSCFQHSHNFCANHTLGYFFILHSAFIEVSLAFGHHSTHRCDYWWIIFAKEVDISYLCCIQCNHDCEYEVMHRNLLAPQVCHAQRSLPPYDFFAMVDVFFCNYYHCAVYWLLFMIHFDLQAQPLQRSRSRFEICTNAAGASTNSCLYASVFSQPLPVQKRKALPLL